MMEDQRKMIIAYPLSGTLYLNITNRCDNACIFCIRNHGSGIGYDLWLDHEPTVHEVISAIGDPAIYREVVFCGYGEPLTRPEVVLEVSKWLKSRGASVRVNTNGLADLFLKEDIVPRMAGWIDTVSISLNAADAKSYAEITRSKYGLKAFPAMLEFTKRCRNFIPRVILSVVDYPGVDLEKGAEIAKDLNVEYKIRILQQ